MIMSIYRKERTVSSYANVLTRVVGMEMDILLRNIHVPTGKITSKMPGENLAFFYILKSLSYKAWTCSNKT